MHLHKRSVTAQAPLENSARQPQSVCGGSAHACTPQHTIANIAPFLKVVHEQPANQHSRYQPMASTKSRYPSSERACTRAQGKRDTTHAAELSSARTLRYVTFLLPFGFGHCAILIFGGLRCGTQHILFYPTFNGDLVPETVTKMAKCFRVC